MTILSWSRELLVTLTKQLNSLLAFTHCAIHRIIFIKCLTKYLFVRYTDKCLALNSRYCIYTAPSLYILFTFLHCVAMNLCGYCLFIAVSSSSLSPADSYVTAEILLLMFLLILRVHFFSIFFVHTFRGCRQEGLGVVSGDMEAGCSLSRLSPLSCH